MSDCHFLMRPQSLSRVRDMPWKSVRQLRPWSSSWFRSARFISSTRPLSESLEIFVPCVLDARVLPQERTVNMDGALMSYHSFFKKGSPTFFLPPFLLFVSRLFLPTAMTKQYARETRTRLE